MAWWGWLVIGVALMVTELTAIDAAFYLVFIGFSAMVVGLLGLFGLTMSVWAQWLLFGALAFGSMVLFRRRLYQRIRRGDEEFSSALINKYVSIDEDVPPGQSTRIAVQGSRWTAFNAGDAVIPAKSTARVVSVQGLVLNVVAQPAEGKAA